ncbi:uncharacterized protein LOC107461651 [Arachis duranensis]|uniref:Uncharacterized protein LOC107461651 n=1 Tax=Arachis duranensis TaxID=130453 RepID=A0A6P4BCT3_ARADU|nr:uncharacterized protein LOC107461651 [Arachis duranensis]XP_052109500.1 uncharacterized protein LOC107461651 [Arachis duranensis]
MGDMVDYSNSNMTRNPKQGSVATGKKSYRKSLILSRPKSVVLRYHQHLVSLIDGDFGTSAVGRITIFALKVAALEIVRRFSKSKCPFVWKGLQALQILCYPPFQWIQRWAPFKGLVESMQVLSRPLLALSIATIFSDQSKLSDGKSDCVTDSHSDLVKSSELSTVQADMNTSQCSTDSKILESEYWLSQLFQELESQGICLPERINNDELRRFYAASNNDFSCFLTSIKKTVRWREAYRILTEEELEKWSKVVFWHGYDVMHRPCLIVKLGLACSTLASEDRPRFAQAVVSHVEHGIVQLVDADNPQITVLVDCEGLSPLKIPMQMMKSCCSLLQEHFPNRLGCLFVIRLPEVLNFTAQSFIQSLEPTTRKKLKMEGKMYHKVLTDNLPALPSYLGGCCTCSECSEIGNGRMLQPHTAGTSRGDNVGGISDSDNEDSTSLHLHRSNESEDHSFGNYEQLLRTVLIGFLIFWVFISLGFVMYDAGSHHFLSS